MRFLASPLFGLALLLSVAALHAQTTQPARVAIPTGPALQDATSLVNDAYGAEIAAAKTPAARQAVVQKLLAAAKDEKGANRYALLARARDAAVEAGDVQDCAAALDALDASFDGDLLKIRADSLLALVRTVRGSDDLGLLGGKLSATVQMALAADRFDVALSVAEAGLGLAQRGNDAEQTKLAVANLRTVRESETAYVDIKKALAVLADKPNDPDANLKVGKYRCFLKDDWTHGLPLLALGNDAALKALARKELAGLTAADDQIKVADDWWDLADKLTGPAQLAVHAHAAKWYQDALPSTSGLQKAKLEQRIAKYQADMAALQAAAGAGWIDLLKLVDVSRDVVGGKWTVDGNGAVCDASRPSLLELPYVPPAEYDLRASFTRNAGTADVLLILIDAHHQTALGWDGGGRGQHRIGFDTANGKRPWEIGAVAVKQNLTNGQKYTFLVQVRRAAIYVFIDGTRVITFLTDGSNLDINPYYKPTDADCLGISSWESSTTFHSVEVREITGKGKIKFPPEENK